MKKEEKQAVFVPIQNRQVARNLLRTDIIRTLAEEKNLQIFVFVPAFKKTLYQREFPNTNIHFVDTPVFSQIFSLIDLFFHRLSLLYINTSAARFARKRFLYYERRQPVRYFISMALLFIFGSLKPIRALARKLDFLLVQDKRTEHYFDTYQPSLVFSGNITNPFDMSLIRTAKKRKIPTIGMIKSWDNITFTKYPFRIMPDKIICHNKPIQRDVVSRLDVKEKDTFISGIPHFDFYFTEPRSSREAFCKRVGVEPHKRIVLFASIGSTLNQTETDVLADLGNALQEKKLPDDLVVIFRQHPAEKTKIKNIVKSQHIVVDDSKTKLESQNQSFSEILSDDMIHLADSIHHSDVIITTCSTMAIDSSALDTPIIDLAFDGREKRPFYRSVRRYYTPLETHYWPITQSNATSIAYSFDELVLHLKYYLKYPEYRKEERSWVVDEYCYRRDGKAGRRAGKFILSHL